MKSSGGDCGTPELNQKSAYSSSVLKTTSGRKLRPIMPRPRPLPINSSCSHSVLSPNPPPSSSACSSCFLHKPDTTVLSTSTHHPHHLGPIQEQQSKQEDNTAPLLRSRWNPTVEQLRVLKDIYEGGTQTPTAEQIRVIAEMLRRFGKIEGKNVFYWFQNHKARERQKRRRRQHGGISFQNEEPAGFEVGQAKNNATSNCSTKSEVTVSIHRAVGASESKAQGRIQLKETELLQQRRTRSRITQSEHATWQLMEPSSTAEAFGQFLSTAREEALELSMNLAPNNGDMNVMEFEEDDQLGGNQIRTLQLFPIRTRDWSEEERGYEVMSMASMDTSSFVPNQFFEFLPLRN